MKFIMWASSKEYIRLVAEKYGWAAVPPGTRASTYLQKEYRSEAPFGDIVQQIILKTTPDDFTLKPVPYKGIQFVNIPEFPSIGRRVGLEINAMLKGKISVDEALQNSQALVKKQMTESEYFNQNSPR